MYSQKTSNVILAISGVLLTFVILYLLSNTVSRVGHFPNHFLKTIGVFLFSNVRLIGVIRCLSSLNSDSIISQSGFISGKKASASKS
jgi:uncharacterized membrane protein